uniref:Phostensin n=1 Tax=Sphaeramia orbicularis TaxID=375764 RepID=A0A672YUE6_9TELE
MSVSSLPEWKQLLLEKKRREEEERERREKEEEEKFASMPAWKRGIIQRRKARQESLGDREKDREVLETIVPVHENPFIRTQSSWKKGRDSDAEKGNESEVKEREKTSPRGHDVESGSGRDIELRIERFRDLSEGRDKERSRDRSQGREGDRYEKSSQRESGKDRELLKVRKDEEEKEVDPSSPVFSPHPCLRTIRADNIIIIEQDRKSSDERRGVERRDSWRIGKPLSRIESLREKIRQRELEKLRQKETQDGEQGDGADMCDNVSTTAEERGTEAENEWEAAAHMRKRLVEAETGQEEVEGQTSMAAYDQNQTITITPSPPSQSPENTLKPSDYAPTPASSPCSPSPAQSPNLSPSPSPSPTLFSIRSASGGQVKRGATITITPKKPSGGGRGGGAIVSTPAGLTAMKTPSQTANTGAEPAKKKYPTVDEIEVIGGYLHLEKSCLVKNRGTPKRVSRKQTCRIVGQSKSNAG